MTSVEIDRPDALVRTAHAAGYHFPAGFTGFTAELRWETDEGSGTGTAVAGLRDGVKIAVEAPDAPGWVTQQLQSIVSHRAHRPYAEGDGAHEKQLAGAGPLGERVELGDSMQSEYVIGDDGISLVTRTHGGTRFTIVVQQRLEAPDGTRVPTAFTVAYWREDGGLIAAEAHTDAYADLDGVLVPSARSIVRADDEGLSVRRLTLSGHRSLETDGDAS